MIRGKLNVYPQNAFYQIKRFSWSKSKISPDVLARLDVGFARLMRSKSDSLLKKYLTKETFLQLRTRRAARSNLLDCVQSGFVKPNSKCGVFAAEPDSYQVYAQLFDPIIKEYHYGFSETDKQPPFDPGRPWELDDIDPLLHHIAFTRIRCARSIKGYPFHPIMTRNHYLAIEKTLNRSLNRLQNEFKGKYYRLIDMSQSTQERLIAQHLLFKEGDPIMKAASATRFWPDGRGVYFNPNKTFIVWCNEADHVRVISMQRGANFGQVFSRLMRGLKAIGRSSAFEWEWDKRLGYLTFCPMNLGSTIRASVQVHLPNLASRPNQLLELATKHRLDVRSTGPKTYEISNRQRLGITEFDAVNQLHTGMVKIIKLEKVQFPSKKRAMTPKYISDCERIAARGALRVKQQKEAVRLGNMPQKLRAHGKNTKAKKEGAEIKTTSLIPLTQSPEKEDSVKPSGLFQMIRSYLKGKMNQNVSKLRIQIGSTGKQANSESAVDKAPKVSLWRMRMSKSRSTSGQTKKKSNSKGRAVPPWRIRIWTLRDKIGLTAAAASKDQRLTQNVASAPKAKISVNPPVARKAKTTPQLRALISKHRARAGPSRRKINPAQPGKANYKAIAIKRACMSKHRVKTRPARKKVELAVANKPKWQPLPRGSYSDIKSNKPPLLSPKSGSQSKQKLAFAPNIDARWSPTKLGKEGTKQIERKGDNKVERKKWSGVPSKANTQKINPTKGGDKRTFSSAPKKPDMPGSPKSKEGDTKKHRKSRSTPKVRPHDEQSKATSSKIHGVRAWKARISESQSDSAKPRSKQVDPAVADKANEVLEETTSPLAFWTQVGQSKSADSETHGVHAWKTRISKGSSGNAGATSKPQVDMAMDDNPTEHLQTRVKPRGDLLSRILPRTKVNVLAVDDSGDEVLEKTVPLQGFWSHVGQSKSASNKTHGVRAWKRRISKGSSANPEKTSKQKVDMAMDDNLKELLQKTSSASEYNVWDALSKIETSKSQKATSGLTTEHVYWAVDDSFTEALHYAASLPDLRAQEGTTAEDDETQKLHIPEIETSKHQKATSGLTNELVDWPVDDILTESLQNATSAPELRAQEETNAEDSNTQKLHKPEIETSKHQKATSGLTNELVDWPVDDNLTESPQNAASPPEMWAQEGADAEDGKIQEVQTPKIEASKSQKATSEPTSEQVYWPVDDNLTEALQNATSAPELRAQERTNDEDDKTQKLHTPEIETSKHQKATSGLTNELVDWPVDDNLTESLQNATSAPELRAQEGTNAEDGKIQEVQTPQIEASKSQKATSEPTSEQVYWPVDDNLTEALQNATSAPELRAQEGTKSEDSKTQEVLTPRIETSKSQKTTSQATSEQVYWPVDDLTEVLQNAASAPELRAQEETNAEDSKIQEVRTPQIEASESQKATSEPTSEQVYWPVDDNLTEALQNATSAPELRAQEGTKSEDGKTQEVRTPRIETSKSQKATSQPTSEQVYWPVDDLAEALQNASSAPELRAQERTKSEDGKTQEVLTPRIETSKSQKATSQPTSEQVYWPVDDLTEVLQNAASAPELRAQEGMNAEDSKIQEVQTPKIEASKSQKATSQPTSEQVYWPVDDLTEVLQNAASAPELRAQEGMNAEDSKIQEVQTPKIEASKSQKATSQPTSEQVYWPVDDLTEVLQNAASAPELRAQEGMNAEDSKIQEVQTPKIEASESQKATSEPTSEQGYWPVNDNLHKLHTPKTETSKRQKALSGLTNQLIDWPVDDNLTEAFESTALDGKTEELRTPKMKTSKMQKGTSGLTNQLVDWPVDDNFTEALQYAASLPDLRAQEETTAVDDKTQEVGTPQIETSKSQKATSEPTSDQIHWPVDDNMTEALGYTAPAPELSAQEGSAAVDGKTPELRTPKIEISKSQKATSLLKSEFIYWPVDDNLTESLQNAASAAEPRVQERTTTTDGKAKKVRSPKIETSKTQKATSESTSEMIYWPVDDNITDSLKNATSAPELRTQEGRTAEDDKTQKLRTPEIETSKSQKAASEPTSEQVDWPRDDNRNEVLQKTAPVQGFWTQVGQSKSSGRKPHRVHAWKTRISIISSSNDGPTSKQRVDIAMDNNPNKAVEKAASASELGAQEGTAAADDKTQGVHARKIKKFKCNMVIFGPKNKLVKPTTPGTVRKMSSRGDLLSRLEVTLWPKAKLTDFTANGDHQKVLQSTSSARAVSAQDTPTRSADDKTQGERTPKIETPKSQKGTSGPTGQVDLAADDNRKEVLEKTAPLQGFWTNVGQSKSSGSKTHGVRAWKTRTSKRSSANSGPTSKQQVATAMGDTRKEILQMASSASEVSARDAPTQSADDKTQRVRTPKIENAKVDCKSKLVKPAATDTVRKMSLRGDLFSRLEVTLWPRAKLIDLALDGDPQEVLQTTSSAPELKAQDASTLSTDGVTQGAQAGKIKTSKRPESKSGLEIKQIDPADKAGDKEQAISPWQDYFLSKVLAQAAHTQITHISADGKAQAWPFIEIKSQAKAKPTTKQINTPAVDKYPAVSPWRALFLSKLLAQVAQRSEQAADGNTQTVAPWPAIRIKRRARTKSTSDPTAATKDQTVIPWQALLLKLQAEAAQKNKKVADPAAGSKTDALPSWLAVRTKRRAQATQTSKQVPDPTADDKIKAGSTSQQVHPATADNDQTLSPWRAVFLSKLQAQVEQTSKQVPDPTAGLKITTRSTRQKVDKATADNDRTLSPWRAVFLSKLQAHVAQTSKQVDVDRILNRPAKAERTSMLNDPAADGEPQWQPQPKDFLSSLLSPRSSSQSKKKLGFSPNKGTHPNLPELEKKATKHFKHFKIKHLPPGKPDEKIKKANGAQPTQTNTVKLKPNKRVSIRSFSLGPKKRCPSQALLLSKLQAQNPQKSKQILFNAQDGPKTSADSKTNGNHVPKHSRPSAAAVDKNHRVVPWRLRISKYVAKAAKASRQVAYPAAERKTQKLPSWLEITTKHRAKTGSTSKQVDPAAANKNQAVIPRLVKAAEVNRQGAYPTAQGKTQRFPSWLEMMTKDRAKSESKSKQIQPATANKEQAAIPWRALLSKLQVYIAPTSKQVAKPSADSKTQTLPKCLAVRTKHMAKAGPTDKLINGRTVFPLRTPFSKHLVKTGSTTDLSATKDYIDILQKVLSAPSLRTKAGPTKKQIKSRPRRPWRSHILNRPAKAGSTSKLIDQAAAGEPQWQSQPKSLLSPLLPLRSSAQSKKKLEFSPKTGTGASLPEFEKKVEHSKINPVPPEKPHKKSKKVCGTQPTQTNTEKLKLNKSASKRSFSLGPKELCLSHVLLLSKLQAVQRSKANAGPTSGQVDPPAADKDQRVIPWHPRISKYVAKAAEASRQLASPAAADKTRKLPPWLEIRTKHCAKTGSTSKQVSPAATNKDQAVIPCLAKAPEVNRQVAYPAAEGKTQRFPSWLEMMAKDRAKTGSTSKQILPATANKDQAAIPWRALLSKLQAQIAQTNKQINPAAAGKDQTVIPRLAKAAEVNRQVAYPAAEGKTRTFPSWLEIKTKDQAKTGSTSKQILPVTANKDQAAIPWRTLLSKLQVYIAQSSKQFAEPSADSKTKTLPKWLAVRTKHRAKAAPTDKLIKGQTVFPLRARIWNQPVKAGSTTGLSATSDYIDVLQKVLSAPSLRTKAGLTNKQVESPPRLPWRAHVLNRPAIAGSTSKLIDPAAAGEPQWQPQPKDCFSPLSLKSNSQSKLDSSPNRGTRPSPPENKKKFEPIKIRCEPFKKPDEKNKKGCYALSTKTSTQKLNPIKIGSTRTFSAGPKKPKNPCCSQSSDSSRGCKKKQKKKPKLGWEGCTPDSAKKDKESRCKKLKSSSCGKQKKKKLGWEGCIPDPPKKGRKSKETPKTPLRSCCLHPKDPRCKKQAKSCSCGNQKKPKLGWEDCIPDPPKKGKGQGCKKQRKSSSRKQKSDDSVANCGCKKPCPCPNTCHCKTKPKDDDGCKRTFASCAEASIRKTKTKEDDPPAEGRSKTSVCKTNVKTNRKTKTSKSSLRSDPPAECGDKGTSEPEVKGNVCVQSSLCRKSRRKRKDDGCIPSPRKVSRRRTPPDVELALRTGYIARPDLRRKMRKAMKKKEKKRRATARTRCIGLDQKEREAALHRKKIAMRKEAKRQKEIEKKKAAAIKKLNLPWLEDNKTAGTKETAKKTAGKKDAAQKTSCTKETAKKKTPKKNVPGMKTSLLITGIRTAPQKEPGQDNAAGKT